MRYEFKYIVPVKYLDDLHYSLRSYLELDRNTPEGKQKEYICRSIYYDTKNLDTYYEKIEGIKERKKFRIRGYNNKTEYSTAFLEIKRKNNDIVSKNRALVYFNDINTLLADGNINNYKFPDINPKYFDDAIKFLYYYKTKSLKPTVLVVYDREAYFMKHDNNIRITFDKNLRCKAYPSPADLFIDENLQQYLFNYFILEIKFYSYFPKLILPGIIKKFNLLRNTYSKYTNACLFCNISKNYNTKEATFKKVNYY